MFSDEAYRQLQNTARELNQITAQLRGQTVTKEQKRRLRRLTLDFTNQLANCQR